ncbi:hypothetical protein EI555_009279, partial [Monodon monoceros]
RRASLELLAISARPACHDPPLRAARLGPPRPSSASERLKKPREWKALAPERNQRLRRARALRGGVARSGQRLGHPGLLPEAGPERAALPRAGAGLMRRGLRVSEEERQKLETGLEQREERGPRRPQGPCSRAAWPTPRAPYSTAQHLRLSPGSPLRAGRVQRC